MALGPYRTKNIMTGTLPEDQVFGREEEEEEEAPESSKDKEEAGEQGPAQGDDQATDTTNTTLDMSGDCRMQEVNGTMALVESHASCCSFTHKAYASQCCRADGSHMKIKQGFFLESVSE